MNIMGWANSQEIKELMCGNKMVVIACTSMNVCGFDCHAYEFKPID